MGAKRGCRIIGGSCGLRGCHVVRGQKRDRVGGEAVRTRRRFRLTGGSKGALARVGTGRGEAEPREVSEASPSLGISHPHRTLQLTNPHLKECMRTQTTGSGATSSGSSMTPSQAAAGTGKHNSNPKTHSLKLFCASTAAERAGNPGDTGVCRSQVLPGSWLAQTWPRAATGPQSCRAPRPQCPGLLGLGVSGCCVRLLIRPLPVLPQPTSPEQLLDMLAKGNKNRAQRHTKANATSSCSHAIFQVRAAASGIAAIAAGNGAGKQPGPACQGCPTQQRAGNFAPQGLCPCALWFLGAKLPVDFNSSQALARIRRAVTAAWADGGSGCHFSPSLVPRPWLLAGEQPRCLDAFPASSQLGSLVGPGFLPARIPELCWKSALPTASSASQQANHGLGRIQEQPSASSTSVAAPVHAGGAPGGAEGITGQWGKHI